MYQAGIHRSCRAFHFLDVDSVQESHPHEHRYSLELVLACTELDENGLVIDPSVMDECVSELLVSVEGRLLNDELFFSDCPPTAENLARFLCDGIANRLSQEGLDLKRLASIEARVRESESCWVSFSQQPIPKAASPRPRKRAAPHRETVQKPRR